VLDKPKLVSALGSLAASTPLLAEAGGNGEVEVDDTTVQVHGYKERAIAACFQCGYIALNHTGEVPPCPSAFGT